MYRALGLDPETYFNENCSDKVAEEYGNDEDDDEAEGVSAPAPAPAATENAEVAPEAITPEIEIESAGFEVIGHQ